MIDVGLHDRRRARLMQDLEYRAAYERAARELGLTRQRKEGRGRVESFTTIVTTMTDGSRTVAEAVLGTEDGELLAAGTGSSGREPGDKPDDSVGTDLAVARALRSLAAHLERRAKGRVAHAESVKAHKAEIATRPARTAGWVWADCQVNIAPSSPNAITGLLEDF